MEMSVTCGVSDLECISIHDLKQLDVKRMQTVSTDGNDPVADLGDALSGILHIQNVHESLSVQLKKLDRDGMCHPEVKLIDLTESVTGTIQKGLTKSATFSSSKKDVSVDEKTEMTVMGSFGQSSSDLSPCYMRSISLPTPLKLVSGMKGSREQQGAPLRKMKVTWASDVYDPPSTSLSHTVRSYNQQRSRSSKRNGKHKHKGKSSRGSTSDKKQYRRSVTNSDMRSKSTASKDRPLFDGFNQSTVELVDFVAAQDSNCGSIFLRTSLAKVQMPVAEAT